MLYELHVGSFSPEGSFDGLRRKLDHLVTLGVTAVELMPVADFPGGAIGAMTGCCCSPPTAPMATRRA